MVSELQTNSYNYKIAPFDYFQVVNQSPFAIIISNQNQEIIYANQLACLMLKCKITDEERPKLNSIFKLKASKWETKLKALIDHNECHFEVRVAPLKGRGIDTDVICKKISYNNLPATLTFIRDISDQKILEKKLFQEQATRQMILDSIPAMVFVKDTNNCIISINKTFEEQTGLSMENISGRNLIEVSGAENYAEEYWKDDLEVIETGLPKRNIIEPLITDHSKWFITDKMPYRNTKGEIVGVIGFSMDITERKNAEDALVRSEKKFRLLFDSSPDGIVITNLKGRFLSANKAFQKLLNYTDDEIVALCFNDISTNTDKETEINFINRALTKSKDSEIFEKVYLTKSGNHIPVRVTCWIINDYAGKPLQLGVYVKDISYEKKAEKLERSLLQKEKEQLELELQAKTQELNSKVTQLIEKNELVNNLVNQLENLIIIPPEKMYAKTKSIIRELKNKTNEDFWTQFETTFGQINQSFYKNIFHAFPSLTGNERKISAFLKMNLSTKDISNITHQSIRSIEMARSRLRKKLHLKRTDNLTKFLNQF